MKVYPWVLHGTLGFSGPHRFLYYEFDLELLTYLKVVPSYINFLVVPDTEFFNERS